MQSNKLSPKNAETLEKYYSAVNVGDFMGAVETLSPDVVFSIPGDPSILPFSGEWVGREKVMELFKHFINAFHIVHMDETCIVSNENEMIAFNDESFKVKTTGRYYRVGVVHHMTFDENGLIKSLINVHDTYTAVQAFSKKSAIAQPVLPPVKANEEIHLSEQEATVFAKKFYGERLWEDGSVAEFLADNVTLIAPGDPEVMPFSGVWIGKEGVLDFIDIHKKMLLNRQVAISTVIANYNVIAVVLEETGTVPETGEPVTIKRYDLLQLASADTISHITLYTDTYPISQLNK